MCHTAVVYARVSSKDQEREGFSIPAQLDLLRSYAAGRQLKIAVEFVDIETAKQAGRAAFGEMVVFARKHPGRLILLVEKTDRLYRNLRDWVTIDELDLEGTLISLRATTREMLLTTTPSGALIAAALYYSAKDIAGVVTPACEGVQRCLGAGTDWGASIEEPGDSRVAGRGAYRWVRGAAGAGCAEFVVAKGRWRYRV